MVEEENGLSVRLDGEFVDFMKEKGLSDEEIRRVAKSLLSVWAKQKNVDHEKEVEILLG